MLWGNTHQTSVELKKNTDKYPFIIFLKHCGGYIHCSVLVHEDIQYVSSDTMFVEVEILDIQGIQSPCVISKTVSDFPVFHMLVISSNILNAK